MSQLKYSQKLGNPWLKGEPKCSPKTWSREMQPMSLVIFMLHLQRLSLSLSISLIHFGLCTNGTNNIIGSIISTIGRRLCAQWKRKRIFTLTSYNLCILPPILKHEAMIFVILNSYACEDSHFLSGWVISRTNIMVKIVYNRATYPNVSLIKTVKLIDNILKPPCASPLINDVKNEYS